MKKVIPLCLIVVLIFLTSCGNNKAPNNNEKTYKQENSEVIKIPKKPKKVAVLNAFYVGDFIKLGIDPIAVPDWTVESSILKPYLKETTLIGDGDIEKLASIKPDLIVADSSDKNLKKYKKIAPTVAYNYNDYDYKGILRELGELTGKEKVAKNWISHWENQSKKDKAEIQNATKGKNASVFELDAKGLYIYSNNWGRGLEIIHDTFGMPMTDSYEKEVSANKEGYKLISNEKIDEYAGDYIFLSEPKATGNDFEQSNMWKNLPAVKSNRVIKYEAEDYWFTDPITLEHLRKKLKKEILSRE